MAYLVPSFEHLHDAASMMLVEYKKLQKQKIKALWGYSFFGSDGSRIDDIAFLQYIATELANKSLKADRQGNVRSFEGREEDGVSRGKCLTLVGAFLFILEQIEAQHLIMPVRSSLYGALKKALNLSETNKMDKESRHRAFAELLSFLSEQDTITLDVVGKRDVKNDLVVRITRYINSLSSSSFSGVSLGAWFS